jgi:hypothetical protein
LSFFQNQRVSPINIKSVIEKEQRISLSSSLINSIITRTATDEWKDLNSEDFQTSLNAAIDYLLKRGHFDYRIKKDSQDRSIGLHSEIPYFSKFHQFLLPILRRVECFLVADLFALLEFNLSPELMLFDFTANACLSSMPLLNFTFFNSMGNFVSPGAVFMDNEKRSSQENALSLLGEVAGSQILEHVHTVGIKFDRIDFFFVFTSFQRFMFHSVTRN